MVHLVGNRDIFSLGAMTTGKIVVEGVTGDAARNQRVRPGYMLY